MGLALDIGHFQEAESRREHPAVSLQSTMDFSCHFVQCQLTPITLSITKLIFQDLTPYIPSRERFTILTGPAAFRAALPAAF